MQQVMIGRVLARNEVAVAVVLNVAAKMMHMSRDPELLLDSLLHC
jgi:hypothetical protein